MSRALLAYRPTPPAPIELVRRDATSPLAWAGMRLEGTVVPLWGDSVAPAGMPVTPERRLAALLDAVPPRGVVGRLAAAWVHAGGPPPDVVVVLVPPRGRHTDPRPGLVSAEADLPARDVQPIGAGRVTTVQRTGLDVARWCLPGEAAAALRRLVVLGFDPGAALRELTTLPGGRGVRRARTALGALVAARTPDGPEGPSDPEGSSAQDGPSAQVRPGSPAGPPCVPR